VKLYGAAAALGVVLASMATAQVAILQIQVLEGDGGMYAPGSKASRPLVVEVTDDDGRPVPGAAVSFHLPEDGPSGTFANGLRTDVAVTDEHGRAAAHSLIFNRVAGQLPIRIIAVKEQATAGTLALANIGDAALTKQALAKEARQSGESAAKANVVSNRPPHDISPGHGHKKLILILGAVAAGAAAGMLIRAEESKSGSSASGPQTTATPPTIGSPTVSVGTP
jgi:hypothetical protein